MNKTRLLNRLLSRGAPKRMASDRWLKRRLVAQPVGPRGAARVSSIAMVMRRARWQAAAARHTHAWLVQAVLRAGTPAASTPAQSVLRMVERHTRSVHMVTRVLQSLPARMQAVAPQASTAATLDSAPAAVSATVRRAPADVGYPRMPMTMARAAATQQPGAPTRPDTPPHLSATASAGPRNSPQARAVAPFAATPEPVTLPPLELARVTDHVMTQLEQRALSYRERMGGRP